jgi:hypothetical protein
MGPKGDQTNILVALNIRDVCGGGNYGCKQSEIGD